ncbi:glycine cleavage system aminomethyltransferase GcvT [Halosimplex pelagicum]|uniref:Probable aminomethyltransferase n=1 Tax=Halosimplex pelagicum TaxID=869886 RepID=A0A7D5TFF4_9EURY|nr:glycine cleavage system aminomethyltransferase GcvT [Halosimplex pelagicum]QLH84495.1 glycine cleavage system aminomethyltransferase GcvT [Halosimplex pelagicum]
MTLRQPPLADAHEASGATLTEFGGWEMPVEFDSIRAEHEAVRESVGRFDVSHMGQLTVSGPDALRLTNRLVTNDVADLDPGESNYAAITDDRGAMLDDTVVYRPPDDWSVEADYLVVPNAGHDDEMADRWVDHRESWELDATVENRTASLAMVALQGPDARDLLAAETDADLGELGRFETTVGAVAGVETLVSRTGYTGEPGYELVYPWDEAKTVWSALECQPCGLGARDTLRLEMGFLLSGQDFDPEDNPRNPYEAGIDFAVDLDSEFVGRDALEGVDVEGVDEKLRGIELVDRGVPREGYAVESTGGERLGEVTSGTMSPTLGKGIGLAYLPVDVGLDEAVRVEVRGEPKKARTTATPFLDR